jgi:hypothetical protein
LVLGLAISGAVEVRRVGSPCGTSRIKRGLTPGGALVRGGLISAWVATE